MIIADTNILARIIANDNPEQTKIAANILLNQQVFIPKTVFLELEWVLKSVYRMTRQKIYESLTDLLRPSNVTIEDLPQVNQALKWYSKGLDFADALHLSSAFGEESEFATFDKPLTQKLSNFTDSEWRPGCLTY